MYMVQYFLTTLYLSIKFGIEKFSKNVDTLQQQFGSYIYIFKSYFAFVCETYQNKTKTINN